MKIGVIGCGMIANTQHIPCYMENENTEIKYFCDIIPQRAEKAVKDYGCGIAVADYKEVLADSEVEAISVCTPNRMHSIISIEALKAGKNVLCEKPAARIYSEVLDMIIEFEDGRCAQMYQTNGSPFRITVDKEDNESDIYLIKSDYFGLFLKDLVRFFDTGEVIVPHEQTIDVIAIREAGMKAIKKPYTWIKV